MCYGGWLSPHNHLARAAEGATRGGEKYMASKEMYRRLNHIQGFVPPASGSHFWVETIVFRASAMLQGEKCIALKVL